MSTQYFLAPNGRWTGRTATGQPAVNGKLYTYVAGSDDPKVTYSDPAGENENTNPVILDDAGEASIYWAFDPDAPELYKIELYDADDNLIYEQGDYPTLENTNLPTDSLNAVNFVRNPQFTFWTNSNNYPAILQSASNSDYFADEWLFYRSNTTATVNISQSLFNLGQTTVPGNPLGYLHYTCGDATSAAETYKRFQQNYDSVQTLSGQTVSVAFWARSDTSSPLSLNIIQNFGTGGSPSATVTTTVLTANLTTVWTKYTATRDIPSISGMTIGSNGDDMTSLSLDLPLNTFATQIDICNVQLQAASEVSDFVTEPQENSFLNLSNLIQASIWQTGDIRITLAPTPPSAGWIVAATATTIGNGASGATYAGLSTYALFAMIWNGVSNTYAVIYDSAGSPTTRGASAAADFAANTRLQVTQSTGCVIANLAGSGNALGVTAGSATSSALIEHTHGITDGGHTHQYGTFTQQNAGSSSGSSAQAPTNGTTSSSTTGISINPAGSGSSFSIMQPTIYYNVFMKL